MNRVAGQRVVTLALTILDKAAYRSRTHTVDTVEVRLAIGALWLILRDRASLRASWHKATNVSGHPWDGCRDPYYKVAAALRAEGWDAPVGLRHRPKLRSLGCRTGNGGSPPRRLVPFWDSFEKLSFQSLNASLTARLASRAATRALYTAL